MLEARNAYSAGNYGEAHRLVTELVDDEDGNQHLWKLERGVVNLALQEPDAALTDWREGGDRLYELEGGTWSSNVAAWLGDDTSFDYEGKAYERVMVSAMTLAAEIAAKDGRLLGDDVIAFGSQIIQQHRDIYDEMIAEREDEDGEQTFRYVDPDSEFKFVAWGSYLAAIVFEDRPLQSQVAEEQYALIKEIEPDRPWVDETIARMEKGNITERDGDGVVHVLGLVGRAPYKEEVSVSGTAAALNLASILYGIGSGNATTITVSNVQIDEPRYHQDNPDTLAVYVNGQQVGNTFEVTDIEDIATKEYEATRDYRVARALIRKTVKLAATAGAAYGVSQADDSGWGVLAVLIAGLIWSSAEEADLRCWSLLPASCQALRLELPPGEHDIELRAVSGGTPIGVPQKVRVLVTTGRNSYVLAVTPTERGGPPPLSRQAVEPLPEPEPVLPADSSTVPAPLR